MSRFVTEIKASTAMNRYDLNRIAESLLIPLFRVAFDYHQLRNLNQDIGGDYPGIDLADDEAGVAIQVTSQRDGEKIKHTLRQFSKHELYKKYPHLKVYVLTEKQASYSQDAFDEIIGDRFKFDAKQDIWDFTTLMQRVGFLDDQRLIQVERILESFYESSPRLVFGEDEGLRTEKVYLNLLEMHIPDTLYLADISVDRNAVIKASRGHRVKLRHWSTTRDVVRASLEQQGLSFGVDWIDYEGKIFSFHDLDDDGLPLRAVIDRGTLTDISPDEFYDLDENQERVFKILLWRCLQQKLYHQQVMWQNEERLFIFSESNDIDIRLERWPGNAKGREVFKRVTKKDSPEETWHYKHLAFRTGYFRFRDTWYVQIKPDWFFSYDGYRKSYYNSDNVDWLKKREKNPQVFNSLRLIVHFLKHGRQPELFVERQVDTYPFLSFGELMAFDTPEIVDDKAWLSRETKQEQRHLLEAQKELKFLK